MLKGNFIIGQSGGPTAAINATLSGVLRGTRQFAQLGTTYGAINGIEGILQNRYCNLSEIIGDGDLDLLESTPAAALGSCRVKLPDMRDDSYAYENLFEFFKRLDIRYFFYIGGNDSMDTVAKLSAYAAHTDYEMRLIGVPKTIDNDLAGTDHTPGFGSAAKYVASSVQEIIRDCAVYTLKAVTIVEVMGRDAGWLTASAALPKLINGESPDYVYLPERIFDFDGFYADIEAAFERHPNVVVAVSEGIRTAKGYIGDTGYKGRDVFGHANLSGAGRTLELAVRRRFGCKVRSVELNILQRCASTVASETDIKESVRIGSAAVAAAVGGETGKMMCYKRISDDPYKVEISLSDIFGVANIAKNVPAEYINERGNFVTDECLRYIRPLVRGEARQTYRDGLPLHFVLER